MDLVWGEKVQRRGCCFFFSSYSLYHLALPRLYPHQYILSWTRFHLVFTGCINVMLTIKRGEQARKRV
ncbi:hypothetical protein IWX47DRAFT_190796 [Phyllosticta citricarpa]